MLPTDPWIMFTMFLSAAFPIAGLYLAYRLVRAFERRAANRSAIASLEDRILRLEESMQHHSTEMDKVVDAQQLTTRLLAERPSQIPTRAAP